jgi:hypothetical protein
MGPVAMGSTLWRSRGRVNLTVMLKARFAFRHDSMMVVTSPAQLVHRDLHVEDDPTRSLVEASDVVPYRKRTDVWLTGRAYAPAGRPVAVSVVRVAIYRDGQPVLDKALYVIGDRHSAEAQPEPFESMPLVYEKAYGGIGFDANPVGVGADERPLAPNIVDPDEPERVAGFGPISRYWKLRRQHVTTAVRRELEADIPTVPEGFDWSYFQSAPEDQRLSYLEGDEWLVLDGMHPSLLRVQSRLPKVRAVARVLAPDPSRSEEFDEIALVADTLAIDANTQTCSVTWRGIVPLANEAQTGAVLLAGGIEMPGRTLDWALAYRNRIAAEPTQPKRPPVQLDRSGVTMATSIHGGDDLEDPLGHTRVDAHDPEPLSDRDDESGRRRARPSEPTLVSQMPPTSYRRVAVPPKVRADEREIDGWPQYALTSEHEEVTKTTTTEIAAPGRMMEVDLIDDVEVTSVTDVTIISDLTNDAEQTSVGELTNDAEETNVGEVTNVTEIARITPVPESDNRVDGGEATAPRRHMPLAVDTEPGEPPPIDEDDLPWIEEVPIEPDDIRDTDGPPASDSGLMRETSLPPAPIKAADYAAQLRGAGASEQDIEALLDWLDDE